jgi:hypothetical protein
MSAVYDLFDLDDGNIVGSYPSEAEALAVVRAALRDHGRAAASTLSLIRVDDDGSESLVADGDDLILRADRSPAASVAQHVA